MDRAGEYKTTTAAKLEELKKEAKPTTTSKSAIDAMNMNSEDFEQGVRKLANLLNIPHHPDHLKVNYTCIVCYAIANTVFSN